VHRSYNNLQNYTHILYWNFTSIVVSVGTFHVTLKDANGLKVTKEKTAVWPCKLWGFQCGDYEECRLLGYKTPVRTSQERHYFSATEPSLLTLCKIWGFHGGDYEELRLLGYKIQVRTSQKTHYVSAKESSQLMLCKIWGFHGGDYE
jgi:hypothetical protein